MFNAELCPQFRDSMAGRVVVGNYAMKRGQVLEAVVAVMSIVRIAVMSPTRAAWLHRRYYCKVLANSLPLAGLIDLARSPQRRAPAKS